MKEVSECCGKKIICSLSSRISMPEYILSIRTKRICSKCNNRVKGMSKSDYNTKKKIKNFLK